MKIMFCVGNMGKGGAERVIANLSKYLVSNNHKVVIVTTTSTDSQYELDKNIKIVAVDKKQTKKNIVSRTINRIFRMKELEKLYNPDLILAFLPEPSCRVLIANYFNEKKIIVSVRNDPSKEYDTIFKKILMHILFRRSDGFIFQTKDAKKFFPKKIQDKSCVIPNSLNPNFIKKPYNGKRKLKIVNVGRLEEQKNHMLLLKAFNKFHKIYPEYELHIFGIGSLFEQLQIEIKKLNLENKVFLRGNVDNIKEEIYKAKMFVLSSNYEGMPNALIEAMALGVPSISTDCPCGGPKFLIDNNVNGILVPTNDVEKLTNSMIELVENEEKSKKISKNASLISNKLDPQKINKQWLEYILKVRGVDNDNKTKN